MYIDIATNQHPLVSQTGYNSKKQHKKIMKVIQPMLDS